MTEQHPKPSSKHRSNSNYRDLLIVVGAVAVVLGTAFSTGMCQFRTSALPEGRSPNEVDHFAEQIVQRYNANDVPGLHQLIDSLVREPLVPEKLAPLQALRDNFGTITERKFVSHSKGTFSGHDAYIYRYSVKFYNRNVGQGTLTMTLVEWVDQPLGLLSFNIAP